MCLYAVAVVSIAWRMTPKERMDMLHRRMAHAGDEVVRKLAARNGFDLSGETTRPCEDCIRGKMKNRLAPRLDGAR